MERYDGRRAVPEGEETAFAIGAANEGYGGSGRVFIEMKDYDGTKRALGRQ